MMTNNSFKMFTGRRGVTLTCLVLILSIVLSCFAGCADNNTEKETETEEYAAVKVGGYTIRTTSSFKNDKIIFVTKPGYDDVEYSAETFKEYCLIEDFYEHERVEGSPYRRFTITTKAKSKAKILRVMGRLAEREDAYYVTPKYICDATLEDDFIDNEVCFYVYPDYKHLEFTEEEFADLGCIDLWVGEFYEESKTRSYIMTLSTHSKENVLRVIKLLEERDYVREVWWVSETNLD